MEYTYANENFDKKILFVGKLQGCPKCSNLKTFLQFGLEGQFDDDIKFVMKEENPELYDTLIAETGTMELPLLINAKTGAHFTGFNPGQTIELFEA